MILMLLKEMKTGGKKYIHPDIKNAKDFKELDLADKQGRARVHYYDEADVFQVSKHIR